MKLKAQGTKLEGAERCYLSSDLNRAREIIQGHIHATSQYAGRCHQRWNGTTTATCCKLCDDRARAGTAAPPHDRSRLCYRLPFLVPREAPEPAPAKTPRCRSCCMQRWILELQEVAVQPSQNTAEHIPTCVCGVDCWSMLPNMTTLCWYALERAPKSSHLLLVCTRACSLTLPPSVGMHSSVLPNSLVDSVTSVLVCTWACSDRHAPCCL